MREWAGIAVDFLLASPHAAGLAPLVDTSWPVAFSAKLLERWENGRLFCLIPVGYPAPDAQEPDIERRHRRGDPGRGVAKLPPASRSTRPQPIPEARRSGAPPWC